MWPWEHLAFGYAIYSGYVRLRYGRGPATGPVVALAVTTQLPDLIDKPLAWTLHVLPSGRSLAHTLFVAGVVVALVALLSGRRGRPEIGTAVAVGYASHLLGDLCYPVLLGEMPEPAFLVWPLVPQTGEDAPGLSAETLRLLSEFVVFLGTPRGIAYLLLEVGLLVGVVALWRADGWPGLRTPG